MPKVPRQSEFDALVNRVDAIEAWIADHDAATPPPSPGPPLPTYPNTAYWDVGNALGWVPETRDPYDEVALDDVKALCTSGGQPASSHYARIRRKLPETDGYTATGRFLLFGRFFFAPGFESAIEGSFRMLGTDNYKAANPNEWRMAIGPANNGDLAVVSSHQDPGGHQEMILWQGNFVWDGFHQFDLHVGPAKDNTGFWELWVDEVLLAEGSNVQTVPSTVPDSEVVVDRVYGGIDGAWNQDSNPISLEVHALAWSAE